jgi:ELWxxDGT repeat protein
VMFRAASDAGEELWTSDGTPVGTRPVTDTAPSFFGSSPGAGAQLGASLLFPATTAGAGTELHAVPLLATGGFGAASLGSGCSGALPAPSLSALGQIAVGSSLALRVVDALPVSTVLHYASPEFAGFGPLGACQVYLGAPSLLGTVAADSEGDALLPLTYPDAPALVGLPIYVQAASLEAGGPFLGLASLTQALELIAR